MPPVDPYRTAPPPGYYPHNAAPQHPYYAPPPQVVINNHHHQMTAVGYGYPRAPRKTNSVAVHVILFLFFPIYGNALYAYWVHRTNKANGW